MKNVNVEDLYRLTPIQEGMLFHTLYDGEVAPYFEQFVIPYTWDLDRFESAWRQAIERHPVLRTSFFWEDIEAPVQIVHRRADLPFQRLDWRHLSPSERDEKLQNFLAEDRARGFALDRPPLLRLTAIHWDEASWRIVWSYHHLLLDGWSVTLLMRDLAALYEAAGKPGAAAALVPRRPFRDYVRWLQQQDLAAAEAWWRRTFEGFAAPADLGIDRAPGRLVRPGDVHATLEVVLPAALTSALEDFARRRRLTLHTLVEGAWALALARYSGGADEVIFGSTLSGRPTDLAGADAMIGCFINTLPMRVRTAPGHELVSWLRDLQAAQMEMRRHEHSPLVEIRRWSGLSGDRPLFEAILVFESFFDPASRPSQNGDRGWQGHQRTNFPLTLVVWPGREIVLEARHYIGRFEAEGVSRLLGHLGELLAAFVAAPAGCRIDELPVLPPTELAQLASWNRTETPWPLDRSLHERIADQVGLTPDAVALVFTDESLTYRELAARSSRLADHLLRLGLQPEGLVGVALERSLEMVVALLGILQAGGAYVPLDPDYPAERLAAMAEDAFAGTTAPVILTRSRELDRLPARMREAGARLVLLDRGWERSLGEAVGVPPPVVSADRLAYTIFTSGSTGRPKGAMNAHRGVVNRLLWMQDAYRLGPDDCVLQKTPFSFDVSVWEFFWPLLTGARLVLAEPGGHLDPAYLVRLIALEGITTLHFVPSMLQLFLEEPRLESLSCLRRVMASGEALTAPLVDRFFARLPRGVGLHNLYGPTEAAVDVTAWACAPGGEGSIPIGRPVANTRIRLLDPHLDLVPVGVPGELYIGGVQVGRGYLGRPELTAARFVPDPFPEEGDAGARLYATGDLARWRTDGALDYLGRIDHQVKIHGFRIELGEIEALLAVHPGVREAVVLAREDAPGDLRLAAYVVLAAPGLAPRELREHLRQSLPEPMVPTDFMVLDTLPVSPSGKIDRKALPAPRRRPSGRARIAPRNATEEALAAVWTDLLKIETPGVEDDFFALGGDSIKAVRLVSRVNSRLGAGLRVPDVFKHPTIAALAARLGAPAGRGIAEDHALGLAAIERLQDAILADAGARSRLPEGWEDFYPLSGIEKGMIYYTLLLPDQPIYHDQYAYLLSIADVGAFFDAFELMVARHPTLRSTFHLDDFEEPMKVVHARIPPNREVEDLTGLTAEEQGRRIHAWRMDDLRRRFTFRGELLWRLKVFRLEEELYSAVWTWHHAILDGWSNLTFWVEMNRLCGNAGAVTPEALEPLASTYKDYLAITLGRGRSPETEGFWRAALADAGRNRLPFQRTVTRAEPVFGMRVCDRMLGGDLLGSLRARAAELGVSIKSVCLAAHLHLLHVTAGEDDVMTGVVSHDRPGIADGDRIIGCFLNTVPIRLRLAAGESGGSLIRRVSDFLAAESEHEIPLVDVAALVGARDSAQNPLFDTLLNFMDYHLLEDVGANALFRPEVTGANQGAFDLERYEMTNTLFDLEVSATLGHFAVRIKYAPRYFEAEDVERASALYKRVLEALARDLDSPLGTEALLSGEERAELVHAYNDTLGGYSRERPLQSFFEGRAALHPNLPAIVCGGRQITYGELDRQANRVARLLLARGVQPGDNVGVCLPRSPELVAALFGVLKADAAYVPLEPSYPAARKEHIARQSAISFLLEGLPEDLLENGATYSDAPLPVRPRPDDLAYTIYTSGSTGTPKGVMIAHHSAVNLIEWVNREFSVRSGDRVLMLSSVCFDLSVYDLFGALGIGASVVIARQEEIQDPAALKNLVTGQKITFWNSVPSTLGLLVQFLEETDADFRGEDLRLAFLSGDWIPLALPERAKRFFPNLRVISLGGATEATVWSIFHPIEGIDETWLSIPYGRPLDNNTFYVLDRQLELVPPGVVGDLYIGGAGVARGYAGDPEKTAASYMPDPFGPVSGRLYRTGDLGRMLEAGEIEFLGRNDQQVKVRGFRIELGEIESRLSRAPGVREAVVLARTDRAGQKYLCGYVVAAEEVSIGALQEYLAGALPDYMIPDTFVFLSELPLSANGKIDRKALPEPEVVNTAGGGAAAVAPAGATEVALVEIWEEVLGLSGIGATQDFFALGGHSLSAIQVLTRVRRRFEIDLPLPDFFENPTIAGLAAVVERLRGGEGADAAAGPGRRERPERLPLSFAQERLWFLDRLQPGSPFYNLPMAIEMRGVLSVPALAASLGEVVRRHEVLRTSFPLVAGSPVQRIAPSLDVTPPSIDLGGLPGPLFDSAVARLTHALAVQPFDLATGPLLRYALLRLGTERHVVLLSMHHIVTDGWSMALLMQEVATLYRATAAGEPSPLPELPVQYADFTLWQRAWLSGTTLEDQTGWWRRSLAGAPHVLDLPTDRPRPAVQSLRGAHAFAFLPADLARNLQALSLGQGVTSFMTLLALFGTLLHRATGVLDLLIGSPIAGRNHAEVEPLIGLFVNTLVLRVEMAGDPALAEMLGRVRDRTIGAYAHQNLPFEKLVEELHPERSLAHTPMFQVMLVEQNAPVGAVEIPGLTFLPLRAESGTARFDLHLALADTPTGLLADLEYNRDLFDPATITRLLGHLRLLAEGAVRDPAVRLSELPLLSEGESHQLRLGWNDTAVKRRPGLTLPALFAGQVVRTPEAPALTFEGRTLSYRELDQLSGRLAARLVDLGVPPDTAVGVLMERSVEMVIALLGVQKAGAAYLPLDPDYPAERLGWILADARASVVLAQERLLPALPPTEARVLFLEDGWEGDREPLEHADLAEESLAYVLYTSGSTGRPKGVMVPHRGIVNRLLWMQEAYGLTEEDRILQKTPYSFDVSVWEFFWPLITGAHLVLARPGGHRDGAYLAGLIEREHVTVTHFVPSMLQAFLEEPDLSGCAGLRLVVASGEALSPDLRRRFRGRLAARLENLYGPTEAAVDVTAWNCAEEARGGIVPIGRPVANTRIHLLDRAFSPVPIGIPGELAIGGVQLARGYLGRPDLTAERFVPDPCGEETNGGRLYRTGDLARYLPDGAVEYLGRLDFQVKIRGFRIELGEIESILASHPGVRDAVVVARDEGAGDRRLAAYVVPLAGTTPDLAELRSFLAARLPEHMVPPAWILLDELPLSPSGKVDRRALPAPEASLARDWIAPRGPLEQIVAGIWGELLKVERVGLADNFFDLGGDSIKAVRLVGRINERLGADLRVQDVFKHQTVGPLVERIAARTGSSVADEHAAGLAEIERLWRAVLADDRQRAKLPAGHEDFFPLSGIEKGMVYYTLLLPEQPIYHDQHAYVLSIPDLDRFDRALALVIGRHPILRSTFHLDEFAEPLKVVHGSVPVVRDVEDLSALPAAEQGERISRYRAEDLRHKFTFRGEILWRLKLFRMAGDSYVSVWTWHHAILDGWSNLTFWLDLNELLAREDIDRVESLAPLASSYKDYLAITLGRRRAPATEEFWRETLAGVGRNKLPFQRAATRERSAFGMRSLYRPLRSETLLALRERAAELHVPLQALFLAAHLHLLRVTSGEEDVITGVVSHDRPGIPDGDKIVGCFLNTFPIRLRLEAAETGASLARRVARFIATEKEHEIPLVDVAGLVGARESAQNPLFDTLLNFMDFHLMEEVRDNVLFQSMVEPRSAARELPNLESDEMTNTMFDLEVSASPINPLLRIKYLPRHFEGADVARALALYDRILEGLCRDLGAPLAAEALLSDEEREQLVRVYNDTAREYSHVRPLQNFFEQQAALHPDLPAVFCGGRQLTYGELERLANRTARLLLARGVQPGDNVGVCFPRSPELVAGLFGVLKAGAAYVPLEPAYPTARKEHIARQSAISFLLEGLPEELLENGAAYSDAPVPVRPRPPHPDTLAYTIYTSGSTGTPKGVMIAHHSAVNLIEWVNREFSVGSDDRVLMLSSVCFDLSVYDLFGALGTGASVVIARQEEIQDPAALKNLVTGQKITFWNSVPSTLGLLVQYLEETDPDFRGENLRLAFLSGDWIPLALPERARRFFPNLRVIGLGGATEATVWSIFHPVLKVDEACASIPYGRPLDNNTFFVLDRQLELVPPGVVGDLYIGGVGVARGYAGDPEKTAASYRPDPFGPFGGRLYRTGDLGRMLEAGEIEFLGRNDFQVKVRGFRIELGEIESRLSRAPGVREAVVLARTDRAGQKYLCGYVVAAGEVSVATLQEYLAGALPDYMIPDTFVFLSELPLSANGKIDRKALPETDAAHATGGADHVAPANATEAALVAIWEEVLGLSGLGTTRDFFALGGHSLSAIQVLTRVRRRFTIDLPLADFFENSTIAGLASAVERLQEMGAGPAPSPGPGQIDRPERLPLSFAQERLWFLDRFQQGNAAYHIPLALGLRGNLSVEVLAASLSTVAARHEALRTTFAEQEGCPVQRIAPTLDLRLPMVDLEALEEGARPGEERRVLGREAARPFDLERGPLVRVLLLHLTDDHRLALFNVHHIVADGWSMGVLVQEVGALYASLARGERPALPALPIQYADYAVWQRKTWTEEALAEELAFWRERLAGAPPVLDLPLDRPRPAVQRFEGAHLLSLIPAARLAGLAEVQRRTGTTLFMVLLAAFQALLARLTGNDDVVVGSPVAGRHQVETESLIGLFVNTLALRGDLAGDPSFAELLGRVREATVATYAHDALPFERLVEELQPERSLAYAPVFQVLFALQNAPMQPLELPGLTLEPADFEIGSSKLDLSVSLSEVPQGIGGVWEYDRHLFDPATIRRLEERFGLLLVGALADPFCRLSELPLLSPTESHQVLQEWNDTRPESTGGMTVPQLLAEQAARMPEAPALEMAGRTLSYSELERWTDRVARRLLQLGVGPGIVVGLCAERSPELVAGLLGVWKAGAAYLPLDPAYPDARLAFLLEDARGEMGPEPLLLTEDPLAGRLAALAGAGARLLLLDEALAGEPADEPVPPRAQVADPAYLIYTSGTTGVPKAVVVEHRNLAAVLDSAQSAFGFSAGDRMPCLAPFSFDISLFELLGMLLAGGTSVLFALRPTLEIRELTAALGGMTRLHAVPALLRQIVEAAREAGPYPGMRTVFVGGDAVPPELLADLPALFPQAEIEVLYGPTEATIICSHDRATGRGTADAFRLPLGRPLECARIRLLDRHDRPVPVGTAGEVVIGGAGVARGYLGRPELTAERFPMLAGAGLDQERYYRSGDLARHLPDGRLEFLGRIDAQVKVRGFRIEPGEIEAALARHPAVREAVVVVREDGDRQLVAYAVPRAGEEPASPSLPAELRAFLAEQLPEHMVPAFVVPLAALPLSPNGKVDRRALPAPGLFIAAGPSTAPRTAFEEMLAEAWREVLRLPAGSFGVYDNFFALGGHSLLATQVVSRIRRLTSVEIPVRALFERPTLAGLAPYVEQALRAGEAVGEPLVSLPREGFPPLSFTQERLWFLSRLAPHDSSYNLPLQVRLRGALDPSVLRRSLATVVRRHESLRTAFRVAGGRAVQAIAPPEAADRLAMPLADLSALPEAARTAEARILAEREVARPFDLKVGPLLSALLVRLAPEEHLAQIKVHHAVSDAWSTGVLFREIAALYPALREGRSARLPELPVQYADFSVWQRRRLSGEMLAAQVAWWRGQLGGDLAPLDLPLDRPRPAVQDTRGGSRTQVLSAELTRALGELGRREGATLFIVLLAAWQMLLGRLSGQSDVVVGTPVAGRDRQETEGLIGLFLNTLALRTDLGGNPSFGELIGRARETALGAYAHAEVPFEKLVEELRPQRDLSRNPLFDVMLNLVNTPQAQVEIPGLELTFEEPANPGAKFSLTLYASERENRLQLHLVYQTALFTSERAAVILDQLAALLEQAVAEPDRPILSFSLVTAESRALLPDFSLPLAVPLYETVPALVEEQAVRNPEAPAVRQGGRAWSYGELAERSLDLARVLAAAERRGETVAVSGAPSFGLVVALLAVLRSGGVMLTLDPALPPARRRVMAREAGARRLLLVDAAATGEELRSEVEATFRIDPESGRLLAGGDGARSSQAVPPPPAPEDPAYVFFTSGSTGVPKGILGCHRGVSHFLAWQRETFRIGPGDRCSQLTTLSFDALLRDVFLPLTSGATLCLPDAAGLAPAQIVPWLEREKITLIHTLPAVAQAWAGSLAEPVPMPSLRWIFLSGEPLSGTLVRRLRQAFPGEAAVVNLYGPTETTMTKCFFVVPDEPQPGTQPLGHPLPETQALVLGPEDRLCGIGEAGEIVLRTPFRTLGYLNDPDESRRRFAANPFRDDPEDLLYRTGDRGRYRPDGSLEILGRLDGQVKVRGVRVEPGEVEAALLSHPSVAAAVVVARPDAAGEQRLIAYVARAEGRSPQAGELREHLRRDLPDPLLPAAFVVLDALPLGPTGKVDRRALPDPEAPTPSRAGSAAPRTGMERAVAAIWQEVLQLDRVGLHDNFFDLGGHSLRLIEVHSRLTALLDGELPLIELFRHPTVGALARHLEERTGGAAATAPRAAERSREVRQPESRAIAIVGMGGRFPGAPDLDRFWRNLCEGVESIIFFTDEELLATGIDPATLASPRYVKAGSAIEGIDRFDAAFFGFTPREAEILDPQHRLFLELAWEVLERAGYDTKRYPHPIGVYGGVHRSTYLLNLYSHPELVRAVGHGILKQTTDKDYLTTRVSYKLGLRGPSFTVQTTCSTSLVAVHLACQAILGGECRMALAGGVSVRVPQEQGYFREEGDILSPDGHCRPFDAEGRGTIFTNGLGLVLLKGLNDALADGDTIHAVIRGTAINNDGDAKVGYAAPSIDGQAEVIAAAQRAAGVTPETVTYIEAHGTATLLGDPIEIAALTRAFRDGGATGRGFCALGSVKSNLGHLDTAAGVAGLIKTALALEHGLIPPTLYAERPNPNIDFAGSPFRLNGALAEWRTDGAPRRAGVSSFGIGGTNAHAVLEEPPPREPSEPSRPSQLLLLSARTPAALEAATAQFAEHLESHPDLNLADAAFTLQVGRRVFEHRRAVVCGDRADALTALRAPERWTSDTGDTGRPVAFLFPGQGAQHAGMGRNLYAAEAAFREAVDACAELLVPHLGLDLRHLLFPASEEAVEAGQKLTETRFAQPALFVIEHALARLWMEWGIRPVAMIGHSVGEYVAACLAGVFSLPDALALVAARGRFMQEMAPGGMLAVSLPEEPLRALLIELAPEVSLAAVNAPTLCSVSGPLDALDALATRLGALGVEHRRLHTSHAFHSAMMEPALRPFAEVVSGIGLKPPRLRFLSNVTGTWIRTDEATDPGYWARHLREPVRFSTGLSALLAEPGLILLEVGPGRSLASLVRQHAAATSIASMRHPKDEGDDQAVLLRALGRLWMAGAEPDWTAFSTRERRRRVPLPTYPFERRRHWVGRRQEAAPAAYLFGEDPAWAGRIAAAGWRIVTPSGRPLDPGCAEDMAAFQAALHAAVPGAPAGAAESAPDSRDSPFAATGSVAPGDPADQRLAALWEELLGVGGIGSHDDFFELGGHSLLATRLVSRIRETFRVELPIEAIFADPTLARLAARIEAERLVGAATPSIERAPRTGRLPLSFAQQRLLFLEMLTPGDVSYNMPIALRLEGPLDAGALRAALDGLVGRHEILRTTYVLSQGEASQIVAPPPAHGGDPGRAPVPEVDLGALPVRTGEVESRRLAAAEMRRPLDVFAGPVFRPTLLRRATEDHVLLITVHHIATDGWSWGILYGELIEQYEAFGEGRAPRLAELPLQYADFAAWQRSWLDGAELERQIGYWRERLAGLPMTEVPPDRSRPAVRTGRGDLEPFALPARETEALRRLGREEEATLFMVLLSAFFVLMNHYRREDDLVVGTDVANRRWREAEGLIGLFVNQLVIRTVLSGDPTFRELVRQIRRATLEAYAHQDAPFDKLVEALNPVRDMSRTPLFQVKLVLQNASVETRVARGLAVSLFGFHNQTAKFDLLLNLSESDAGLAGTLEYSTDLYQRETAAALLGHFSAVLSAATERPDARLSEIAAALAERDRTVREHKSQQRRETRSQVAERVQRKGIALGSNLRGKRSTE